MEQSKKSASSARTQSKNTKKVIEEAQTEGKTVHFATLMNSCHLKTSVLEKKFQQHEGSVVLRGDAAKDDSGSCAVFNEQGSCAQHMTTAKLLDVISQLPGCAVSLKWRMLQNY